jgi:hypothetical protein
MSHDIPNDAYAMIIGAMKCGTTSLYLYMQDHPQICPAFQKEPEFFSENQSHKVDVEHYNDLFSFDISTHKYTLEASTGYTKYPQEPQVAKNIYEYDIKPKFIYIMRNPFERILSHISHIKFKQGESLPPLTIESEHLINTSRYFLQLEQYRQYFPVDNILVLDFDDLKNAPSLVLKNVYDFLGLPYYFPERYEVANSAKSKSILKVNLQKSKIAPLFGYIPKPFKQIASSTLERTFPPKKRVLTALEKELVYDKLREDMLNLQNVYGFDVGKWGWK